MNTRDNLFDVMSDVLVHDIATLKYLENHPVAEHIRDVRDGCNLLSTALAAGKYSTSLYLLSLWPEAAAIPDSNGIYPLHWAATIGIFSLVTAVYKAYPSAIHKMSRGKTPLYCAVKSGDIDTAMFVVSEGDLLVRCILARGGVRIDRDAQFPS